MWREYGWMLLLAGFLVVAVGARNVAAQAGAQDVGTDDAATLEALNAQVARLYEQGKYQEAVPLARKALELTEKILEPDYPNIAASLNYLAMLYQSMGDYAKAEPLCQRALGIYEKVLGPEHPKTAGSLNNLAGL